MRKLFHLMIMGVAIGTLTACSSDNSEGDTPAKTAVLSGKLEFPALRGGNSIVITHQGSLNENTGLSGVNYSVEWDTDKRSQRWSCYKMYSEVNYKKPGLYRYSAPNDGSLSPTCQYPNDPDLPAEHRFNTGEDPFKYSGYDHGHICPSADRLSTGQANYQTFFITNMQPQGNDFNAGIWAAMEKEVRNWAEKYDTLYVCKGGTIDNEDNIIEYVYQTSHQSTRVNNKHIPVPRYYYMALLGRYRGTFMALGFWINQEAYYSNTPKSYCVTIAELQKLTGIDFFCNLPDDIENEVENVTRSQMVSNWYK